MKEMIFLILTIVLLMLIILAMKVKGAYLHEDIKSMQNELMAKKKAVNKFRVEALNYKQEAAEYKFMYKQLLEELEHINPRRAKILDEFVEKFKEEKCDTN